MKNLIWNVHEIRFRLARWRADRHIAKTNAMIRIMRDVCERQKRILEAGDEYDPTED